MAFAQSNDYGVLTHDLDFGAILAASQGTKPSVVQLRARDVSPDAKRRAWPRIGPRKHRGLLRFT
jgi:predicted nuclease of predicted toxin-antitoxin system